MIPLISAMLRSGLFYRAIKSLDGSWMACKMIKKTTVCRAVVGKQWLVGEKTVLVRKVFGT